jgi:hypothetical protein
MNGNMQVPQAQPIIHASTLKQRVFIAGLLFLGIVRFLDPSAALTNHVSSCEVRSAAGDAVVLG